MVGSGAVAWSITAPPWRARDPPAQSHSTAIGLDPAPLGRFPLATGSGFPTARDPFAGRSGR
ncbi:hypothetical protein NUM3379_35890 [Kineococcus sp. NUM-3379]